MQQNKLYSSAIEGSRAIRAKEAAKILSIGVSTFWNWVSKGKLPKGRRLSSRCTVWMEKDIFYFLDHANECDSENN